MLAVKVIVGKQQNSSRINRETIRAELLSCQRCLLIGCVPVFPSLTVSDHLCCALYFAHTPLDAHRRKLSLEEGKESALALELRFRAGCGDDGEPRVLTGI